MLATRMTAVSKPPPYVVELTRVDHVLDPTNLTEYTFNAVSFGAPHPHRKIIVCTFLSSNSGSGIGFPTGYSIGGVNSTRMHGISAFHFSPDKSALTDIHISKLPNTTSGTVTFTAGSPCREAAIVVYRAVFHYTTDPDLDQATDFNSGSLSIPVDVPPNGAILATAVGKDVTGFAFSNITEDLEATGEMRYATAFDTGLAEETARAVAVTVSGWNSGSDAVGAACVSLRSDR